MPKGVFKLAAFTIVLSQLSCTGGGSATPTSSAVPLGAVVAGATLSGPLAGKTMYLLGGGANFSGCWQDSEYWDGATLWYGLTSISWTHLAATSPAFVADPGCHLPSSQVGASVFNIYAAKLQGGSWNLTNLSFNSAAHSLGAPKLSGSQMVFVAYEKTASALGNIYLTTQTGANAWSAAVAFTNNSGACNEDNPAIYANGTKMVFESNRANPTATSCNGSSNQQLWRSTLVAGSWSTPSALVGAPTAGAQAQQPWLDEGTGKLYWTGDVSICGGGVLNCVLEADPSGPNWSAVPNVLIRPTPLTPGLANGKLVLIGQFTQANGYAFASCGIATETDPTGSTPSLFASRWTIDISACVIPLS